MVRNLFRDWLVFEDQYRDAVSLLKNLVDEAARHADRESDWQFWQPVMGGDGNTPLLMESLPVLDARSEKLGRMVEIVLWHPESDEISIGAYLRRIDDPECEGPKIDILKISLSLSAESAALARTLLDRWMDPDLSYEQVEKLIPEILPHREAE